MSGIYYNGTIEQPGLPVVQTLTGNSGGAVGFNTRTLEYKSLPFKFINFNLIVNAGNTPTLASWKGGAGW